jgi:energy-coupling factor transporter ATP-binding protein EcfA2
MTPEQIYSIFTDAASRQLNSNDKDPIIEAFNEQFEIPRECCDFRTISDNKQTSRSARESLGEKLFTQKRREDYRPMEQWLFVARVSSEEDLVARKMGDFLGGFCTCGILFGASYGWKAYKIYYCRDDSNKWKKQAEAFAAFFAVEKSNVIEIDGLLTMHPDAITSSLPQENIPYNQDDLVSKFTSACRNEAVLTIPDDLPLDLISSMLSKRFLILTGLSGSGKTKIAQAFSQWITPKAVTIDPFYVGAEIKSAQKTYYVKKADSIAVEFWNADEADEVIKVNLPREIISEWADYIIDHDIDVNIGAQKLRDLIKKDSKFSSTLHSFETHLKPAAFALIEARGKQQNAKCYEVVAVGADWSGNENILGYPNGLDNTGYITKPALELILHAQKNESIPHFLILDEMNLSHVERYFADLLSAIESDEAITLHGDKEREDASGIPRTIVKLPDNLFIIGTVNVDETTYMFSPKVLDRANVIEFSMDSEDLEKFLDNPAKPDLAKLAGRGAGYGKAFVEASKRSVDVPEGIKTRYKDEMKAFFTTLQSEGAEYGFRVAHEAARFMHFYQVLGGHDTAKDDWFDDAFDAVIVQKFLPKLHGSTNKLLPLLEALWRLCFDKSVVIEKILPEGADAVAEEQEGNKGVPEISATAAGGARYTKSADKIARMKKLLDNHGFASFAEA